MSTAAAAPSSTGNGPGEIMLFGVRVVVDSLRKTVSLNNLSQYVQPHDKDDTTPAPGYASADDHLVPIHRPNRERERKRGVPWSEVEHKLFLIGLQKVGKGDWRGISRNFVKTRTPTQVASHAQKYFLRRSNLNRRRRRSSLFDITTDTVTASAPMVEGKVQRQQSHSYTPSAMPEIHDIIGIPMMQTFPISLETSISPTSNKDLMEKHVLGEVDLKSNGSPNPALRDPVYSSDQTMTLTDLNLNSNSTMESSALPLGVSSTSDRREDSFRRHSTLQLMPSFSNREGMISVT